MNLDLEALRTSGLTNLEVGQLINRHLSDLGTIDPNLRYDSPFNAYFNELSVQISNYQNGLAQVQKNEETAKIALADADRDKGIYTISAALKLHSLSEVPAEVEASRSIAILFNSFKNLANLNYESETMGIDKLISELRSSAYSSKVSLLQMDRYVNRLQYANDVFKPLFSNRMVTTAMTASYDMKTLRTNLLKKYADFAAYILSMAKATNHPLFTNALSLINTARKYYNDQLSRHAAPKVEKTKPAV